MSVVAPRSWASPYQEHGLGPRAWTAPAPMRPSSWGSEHATVGRAGLGRTNDGHLTAFHADAGRIALDPKLRGVDTPGGQLKFDDHGPTTGQFDGSTRHVTTATFGRAGGLRFRAGNQTLTKTADFGAHNDRWVKKQVRGGSFGHSERWRMVTDHPDEDGDMPNQHMMNYSNARGSSAAAESNGAFGLSGTSAERTHRRCSALKRRQAEKPGGKELFKSGIKAVMATNRLKMFGLAAKKKDDPRDKLAKKINSLPAVDKHAAGMREDREVARVQRRLSSRQRQPPVTRSTMFTYMAHAPSTQVHHSRGSIEAVRPRVGCLGRPGLI